MRNIRHDLKPRLALSVYFLNHLLHIFSSNSQWVCVTCQLHFVV